MHAIRQHAFGPPETLVLDELPDLTPAEGQVRIAVEASGVHLLDTTIRRGEPGPLSPPDLPTVPGREVAGTVDLLGAGVDDAWLGRRVVAHLGPVPGGYAEQAVTAPDLLFPVPDHVSLVDAVAAVGTGRTAMGIVELEPATPDDVVLVLSAAGGLGWLLVQDAKARGARVLAAAGGPERTARLAELAPDAVARLPPGRLGARRRGGDPGLRRRRRCRRPHGARAAAARGPAGDVRLLGRLADGASTAATWSGSASARAGRWAPG